MAKSSKHPETQCKSTSDKSGEKASQKRKMLAEIERVHKAKWMFQPVVSEVKSMLIESPIKCCGVRMCYAGRVLRVPIEIRDVLGGAN